MSPVDAAWHDFADASCQLASYDYFVGGWDARQPEVDDAAEIAEQERERTRVYWQTKVASVEAERDALIQRLASATYERDAFRRARDMLAGLLERARAEQQHA